MHKFETAFLYVKNPAMNFSGFCDALNEQLAEFDISFVATTGSSSDNVIFKSAGMQLMIASQARALPADGFLHSMDSPLSAPYQGALSDTLFSHRSHILITVMTCDAAKGTNSEIMLKALRSLHAAGKLIADQHPPISVHWRQSNQLITGAQYASIAGDKTPWALFARAKVFATTDATDGHRRLGIRLEEAADFIGKPIVFNGCDLPLDQVYATALAFMRHTLNNDDPIPSGQIFNAKDGYKAKVTYGKQKKKPREDAYELTCMGRFGETNRRMAVKLPGPVNLAEEIATARHKERVRSFAISYLMLVILPPIGVLLLISNLFFGANAGRTGLIAMTSVAAVMLVGAYTFLHMNTESVATLDHALPITASPLQD